MTTYMVERDLKGITMDQLAAAQKRAINTGREMTASGKDVRYIRSMFVPGEAFLAAALDADPSLLEHAAARKVVVATPTTLIALLRTVAYAWTQESLASSAREVFDLGRELYSRLSGLGEHVDRLGRSLTTAVTAYNRTVGTLESRVLVSARRLRDLGVVDDEQNAPRPVEETPRVLTSVELLEDLRAERDNNNNTASVRMVR